LTQALGSQLPGSGRKVNQPCPLPGGSALLFVSWPAFELSTLLSNSTAALLQHMLEAVGEDCMEWFNHGYIESRSEAGQAAPLCLSGQPQPWQAHVARAPE
jgi:hypothetical protein